VSTTSDTAGLSDAQVLDLGAQLIAAFESGDPIEPLTGSRPWLCVADAYRVQRALVALHARAGRRVAGQKIGLTSLAMQRQLGIDSPDFGVVLDTHLYASGASLSRAQHKMVAPKLEPEVAVVLSHALAGPGVSVDDVRAVTRAVLPVFEIIDSRVRDWRIRLADTIADNASCFGAVTGRGVPLDEAGPLPDLHVQMRRDGEVVQEGEGAAVMGDPLAAVAWLANELAVHGDAIPPGRPVLCGSFTAAVDAAPGRYEADFGPAVGSVAVELTA
jgi:2-keto-4-pentenoate hydratase